MWCRARERHSGGTRLQPADSARAGGSVVAFAGGHRVPDASEAGASRRLR